MIPPGLNKHAHLICILAKVKALKSLKNIVKNQNPAFFKTLSAICRNFLVGNLPLSSAQKKKLSRFSTVMRRLYHIRDWEKQKSILLKQDGALVYQIVRFLQPTLLKILAKAEGNNG